MKEIKSQGLILIALMILFCTCERVQIPRAVVGAYYFEGWSGKNRYADTAEWAKNAPMQLTERMVNEFPDREPVWGWRDDSISIMEKQIGLAAENGLGFFAFDWYYNEDTALIEELPLNNGIQMYLSAKNKNEMKFCILVANHAPFQITGTENWKKVSNVWMKYFKDQQYLTVDGKPLVIMFSANDYDSTGFEYLQKLAQENGLKGVSIAVNYHDPYRNVYSHVTLYNHIPNWEKGLEKHPYSELVTHHETFWKGKPEQPCIPAVIAGWDKRPWEDPRRVPVEKMCWYYPDRTPEEFQAHLQRAIEWIEKNPEQTTKEKIIVIYAWNEYGEGGYIVPTKGDPDGAYLKAIKNVVYTKQ